MATEGKLKLTALTGYFAQSDPTTVWNEFDYVASGFGLLARSYDIPPAADDASSSARPADASSAPPPPPPPPTAPSWRALLAHIRALNASSPATVSYKLLFLARHGEGHHNLAHITHGKAWDTTISFEEEYFDAHLTATGVAQARAAGGLWRRLLADDDTRDVLAPGKYFVSPLARCLQTARNTFGDLARDGLLPADKPFKPTIIEDLREHIIPHTCDRRSTRTEIAAMEPEWEFEDGFPEDDPLWTKTYWETDDEAVARVMRGLATAWDRAPDADVVSVTAHSGAIMYMQAGLGHPVFRLVTGAVLPVVVKGERV